jgi:SMI1 / KNR4 family (SUKH-1)
MKDHIHDFFGDKVPFHQVIALHEEPIADWDTITKKMPLLPRGWYELSRLPLEDRIEFSHEYWLAKLPFIETVSLEKRLSEFFENLEEIGIYATQLKKGGAFEIHMVYSLKQEVGFFQGGPPASSDTITALIKRFAHVNLPLDYLAFLQIHDGFSKYTDTGMIKTRDMSQTYQRLQKLLVEDLLVRPDGQVISPESLIPFYESFGLHSYQCFYSDWYPEQEMGNVYFSEHDRSMSNFLDPYSLEENLAFSSFLGWLVFYLEDIWHI